MEKTNIEKCKDVIRSYLKKKPVLTRDKYNTWVTKIDHPLDLKKTLLFWDNGEILDESDLDTDEGWACYCERVEDDLYESYNTYDILDMISLKYKVQFLVDTAGLLDDDVVEDQVELLMSSDELPEGAFEPYDKFEALLRDLKKRQDNTRDEDEDDVLHNAFADIPRGSVPELILLDTEYVYRVKPRKERVKDSGIIWYRDWVKAICDSEVPYPLKVEKLKMNADEVLYFDRVTNKMLMSLDYVNRTKKDRITVDRELK